MRSGSSETEMLCFFLGYINVFTIWLFRSLRLMKQCSQWLHIQSFSIIIGAEGNKCSVAGLVEVCP